MKIHWKHLLWLLLVGAAAFLIPAVMLSFFGVSQGTFSAIMVIISGALTAVYARRSSLMPGRFIRPGWAMGIIFGVFIGLVFLSFAAMSNPGFYREFTRPGAAQAVLTSAIRGIAAAILLTVLPFVIVWRAFGEESAGAIRKALIAAAAVVVVAAVSFLYSLGMPGAMQGDLQANFAKTMMAGAPTLISGSPLAAPISHVFLQLSEEAAKPGSAPIKSAEQSLNPSSGRFDSTAGGKY